MALARPPIALQLFTVRDRASQNLRAALEEAAKIGFDAVEFAGLFNHKPSEVRDWLDTIGIRASSSHIGLERLMHDFDRCVDEVKTLGHDFVVIPYLSEEYRGARGYPEAVARMLELSGRLAERGVRLAYHHHSFEFETVRPDSAQRGIDFIIDAPADKLLLEIDVYWARHAGVEPAVFLRRHIHRAPLLHLKDMRDATTKHFAEIGTGILDFHRILLVALRYGVEWLIVEQDSGFAESSIATARVGFEAVRRECERILQETHVAHD